MTIAVPFIPADKANHIIHGALVFLLAIVVARLIGRPDVDVLAAWGVCAGVAFGKEAYDWVTNRVAAARGLGTPPHGVELMDALATLAGGGGVYAAMVLGR